MRTKRVEQALVGKPVFQSVHELYATRGGEFSAEADHGVWWHGEHPFWPNYRLTWIEETGDLYVADLASGVVILVATIPADQFPDDNTTERRYAALDRDESRPLYGWEEKCGPVNGLTWIVKQVHRWEVFV